MSIQIQPGRIPEGGTIRLDPSSGRYQTFDPSYGSDGQFRQASLAELQREKEKNPDLIFHLIMVLLEKHQKER